MEGKVTIKSIISYLENQGLNKQADEIRQAQEAYKTTHPRKVPAAKTRSVKKDEPNISSADPKDYGVPQGTIDIKDLCVICGLKKVHANEEKTYMLQHLKEINPINGAGEYAQGLLTLQRIEGRILGLGELLTAARNFSEGNKPE